MKKLIKIATYTFLMATTAVMGALSLAAKKSDTGHSLSIAEIVHAESGGTCCSGGDDDAGNDDAH